MMNLMKSGGNPQAMFQNMVMSNPQVAETVNLINSQYGGDARAAFYAECEKKGADPNQILSMLQ